MNGEVGHPYLNSGLPLVLRQGSFDEYRATQNVQDKAQFAGNGYSLVKGCNAVLSDLGSSLGASREAAIHGVAPLGKGLPFPARRALWLTASRPAAPINPILTEYWVYTGCKRPLP